MVDFMKTTLFDISSVQNLVPEVEKSVVWKKHIYV